MIDVRELRIGNLVFPDNFSIPEKPHRVALLSHEYIHISGIDSHFVFSYRKDKISPIPITPEWLERAGFEIWLNSPYQTRYDKTGRTECGFDITKGAGLSTSGFRWFDRHVQIQFVHQLQNLYFALTAEELEIKMP